MHVTGGFCSVSGSKFSALFCLNLFSQLLPHVYFSFSTECLKCCFIVIVKLKAITVPIIYKFFFFSYLLYCSFPQHEEEVGELARKLGFAQVSISSSVMPMIRMVPRGYTGGVRGHSCMLYCFV